MTKRFRRAFVAQNTGHDFTGVSRLAEQLVFLTSGYEDGSDLHRVIETGLQSFDPSLDLIVPVGNVAVNMLVGQCLARRGRDWPGYRMAVFQNKEYHVRFVSMELVQEETP